MKRRFFDSTLAESNLAKLPLECYALLPSTGQLINIRRGESGYYPMRAHGEHVFGQAAIELAAELNSSLGITDAQRRAMESGSMFGWDVPAANAG